MWDDDLRIAPVRISSSKIAQSLALWVSFPAMRIIPLENLSVTDSHTSSPSLLWGSASTKSSVMVWKGIEGESMGWKDPKVCDVWLDKRHTLDSVRYTWAVVWMRWSARSAPTHLWDWVRGDFSPWDSSQVTRLDNPSTLVLRLLSTSSSSSASCSRATCRYRIWWRSNFD